jgi:hypothetical protein
MGIKTKNNIKVGGIQHVSIQDGRDKHLYVAMQLNR